MEENKILSAREFAYQNVVPFGEWTMEDLEYLMIEFAKMHVRAAAESMGKQIFVPARGQKFFLNLEEMALSSYPLENIK